jgi:hypothetical protein
MQSRCLLGTIAGDTPGLVASLANKKSPSSTTNSEVEKVCTVIVHRPDLAHEGARAR